MAVAVGIFVEIVLMVFFGSVEILQRLYLYNDRLVVVSLFVGKDLFDGCEVGSFRVVYASAVARSLVVPLFVEARWVNGFEEHA